MGLVIEKYEDVYARLKKCFNVSFGNRKKPGLIPMKEVRKLVNMRRKEDFKNNLPENSLIEIPDNLFSALENTYLGKDESCVSGFIGCAEKPAEQIDGITNMSLLMYLSNHLSKKFRLELRDEENEERKEKLKKNEKVLLRWKDIAISEVIASIFVLSNTSKEHENYFSYGNRLDNKNNSTFVIDLPYVGQLCVHFGWDEKKETILNNAQNIAKSILKKKLELGQITEEKYQDINSKLKETGILPEYEGKLYEYVGAMPIEYVGENIKKYRKIIGYKLPEDITKEDITKMVQVGLNQRELYYFFIKMGASKEMLNEISSEVKPIKPQYIENATEDITLEQFNRATEELKLLAKMERTEKKNPNEKSETKEEI